MPSSPLKRCSDTSSSDNSARKRQAAGTEVSKPSPPGASSKTTQALVNASQNQASSNTTPVHTPSVPKYPPGTTSAADSSTKKPTLSFATMFEAAGEKLAGMTDKELEEWERTHGVYEMNKSTPVSLERAQGLIDEYESMDISD